MLLEYQEVDKDNSTFGSSEGLQALKDYLEVLLHATIDKLVVLNAEGSVQLRQIILVHLTGLSQLHCII